MSHYDDIREKLYHQDYEHRQLEEAKRLVKQEKLRKLALKQAEALLRKNGIKV